MQNRKVHWFPEPASPPRWEKIWAAAKTLTRLAALAMRERGYDALASKLLSRTA